MLTVGAGAGMAVREIHTQSLAKATTLSGFQVMNAIAPLNVIAVLNGAGISFVLVGAYGLAGWTKKPRATEDVDVVVATRHHKKAIRALLAAFPHLEADDHKVVTRLRDRQTRGVKVDLMKTNQALYRAVFKHTVSIQSGGQEYRVPTLEMALAMKFGSMISLVRSDPDKLQDAADFSRMVLSNPEIDQKQLAELGELVYPGGGKEVIEKVKQVRAGEIIKL
jgi:hypothetical protein